MQQYKVYLQRLDTCIMREYPCSLCLVIVRPASCAVLSAAVEELMIGVVLVETVETGTGNACLQA